MPEFTRRARLFAQAFRDEFRDEPRTLDVTITVGALLIICAVAFGWLR